MKSTMWRHDGDAGMAHAFNWANASRKIVSALGLVAEKRSPLRDRKEVEGEDDEHRSEVPALAGRKVAGAHSGDPGSRHAV
ncbi:hypothetical protein [Paraburkholderia sp. SIMBA_030]|uniref:hypothetical protein n=1 Tax=Paraburkholderia sp. SIMBA_030 TaxID=3085773 RepID=UPI00397A67EB